MHGPSDIINRMGKEINNEESIYYWCWKNDIPVLCPAITDGAIGDTLYYNTIKEEGFVIDLFKDIKKMND